MSTRTLTGSFKTVILKPLHHDWNEVGPQLDNLKWIAHRVLNGAMMRMAISNELPDKVPDDWCSKKNENSTSKPGGKPSAYQMVMRAIERANEERVEIKKCSWCRGVGIEPAVGPVTSKGKPIAKTKAQLKLDRKPGDPCSKCNGQGEKRTGEPVIVPSQIQHGWARNIDKRWGTDKWDIYKGDKSISSFRSPAPIAVTSSGTAFSLRREGRNYILELPLFPGGSVGMVPFVLAPDGPNAYGHLRRILEDPSAKLGDLKIIAPKGEGKKKRIVIITYSWEQKLVEKFTKPEAVIFQARDGSPELVVEGRNPKRLYEGSTIRHKRVIFSLRRTGRSKHQRDIGAGARGHGRDRALEHYHAVDDAEQRWVKSICQEIAAKAVKEAALRGAKGVILDSSVKVLPPAALRNAINWVLEREGFPVKKVKSSSDASLSVGSSNADGREGHPSG